MKDDIQKKHTAGAQSLGYDYQFYYFMLQTLQLKCGEKVGFEVKDDVHIDGKDGKVVLYQTKHSTQENKDGKIQNLTTLDVDLWKTLSNWTTFIKSGEKRFIEKHGFVLVTNKNLGKNKFIDILKQFYKDGNTDILLRELREILNETQNQEIKGYIENIITLEKTKISEFFSKISIEVGVDDIINKVKEKILEKCLQEKYVEPIFEKLCSNIIEAKYLDIRNRKDFIISFEDFRKRFGKCFQIAFKNSTLPKRELAIVLPDDLENQIFVKQLIDIGDIAKESRYIVEYTTEMLKVLNHFNYWIGEGFILSTDMDNFTKDSIKIWENEFRSKYRAIERRLSKDMNMVDLEEEIKNLAVELVDFLRGKDLRIADEHFLGTEFSNGHYYALSNNLEIGWHYDWKNKYQR